MLQQVTLYAVVDSHQERHIQAVCATVAEAEEIRQEILKALQSAEGLVATELTIHAMHTVFPGDRYRLVYGTPVRRPAKPLDVPRFRGSRVTLSDAHSEAYLYPDELYLDRKEALAAAAQHNYRQLKQTTGGSLDWAVVVEVGEPLWRRYRSECMVLNGVGFEYTDLIRPVRVIHPTAEEVASGT